MSSYRTNPTFRPLSDFRRLKPRSQKVLIQIRKSAGAQILCIVILIAYIIIGAFTFLYFERHFDAALRHNKSQAAIECVQRILTVRLSRITKNRTATAWGSLARTITSACIIEKPEPRQRWTFINSALYAFGILTTLGYGKIEPFTSNGRIFAAVYGLFGVPITMIIFSNFGKFIEYFVLKVYYKFWKRDKGCVQAVCHNTLNASALLTIVLSYLLFGALLMPLLNGRFDFSNGAYWSFLCFTAIEYGELVPVNQTLLPLAIGYICLGLAISTIALDVGSGYVRRLHFIGRKLRHLSHVNIWFGGKKLILRELVTAIGQNIGLEASVIHNIDLETVVNNAILVKEGKLVRVPQTMELTGGIWPPELVPLFLKEGAFPEFADDDDDEKKNDLRPRSGSIVHNSRTPHHVQNHTQRKSLDPTAIENEFGTIEEMEEGPETETKIITDQ